VPKALTDEWNRIFGDGSLFEQAVDEVRDGIAQSAPDTFRAQPGVFDAKPDAQPDSFTHDDFLAIYEGEYDDPSAEPLATPAATPADQAMMNGATPKPAEQPAQPTTNLADMGSNMAGGIRDNLRAKYEGAVTSTGRLPAEEYNNGKPTLLAQVYERMVSRGRPRTVDTFNEAQALVDRGGDAAGITKEFAAWKDGLTPEEAPWKKGLTPAETPAGAAGLQTGTTPRMAEAEYDAELPDEGEPGVFPAPPRVENLPSSGVENLPSTSKGPYSTPPAETPKTGYNEPISTGRKRGYNAEPAPAPRKKYSTAAERADALRAERDAISDDYIRTLANQQGIPTISSTGRPFDQALMGSLNKRMGTDAAHLADLTPEQRAAVPDVLRERALEKAKPPVESLTKKQIVAEYGDQLKKWGEYDDAKLGRASKRELVAAVHDTTTKPLPDTPTVPGFQLESPEPVFKPKPTPRQPKPATPEMYQGGEDLPLMSGQPYGKEVDTAPSYGRKRSTRWTPEPRPYTTADAAREEVKSLQQARKDIAAAWGKNIQGNITRTGNKRGMGSLDALVRKYAQGGTFNMNLDSGEVKVFQDLYGTTFLGRRIENLDDVRGVLKEYYDLNRRIDGLKALIVDSKQYSKMSAEEILNANRDLFLQGGYTQADLDRMLAIPNPAERRRGVLDVLEAFEDKVPEEFGMKHYQSSVRTAEDWLKINTDDSLRGPHGKNRGNFWDWMNRSRMQGNNAAPTMEKVAEHQIRSIDELENYFRRNIETILSGKPNELDPGQKLGVVDAVRGWLPNVDTALGKGQRVGSHMADWTMLNFHDKRNFDTILSTLMPYPYFWSRMPSRVLTAALSKPSLVNTYYQFKRSLALQNQQEGVPQRLQGTLPIKGQNARLGIENLIDHAVPFMSYIQPNPFVQDDESDNAAESVAKGVTRWTPGLFTLWNMALDMSDGHLDKDYSSVLNNMMPVMGVPASTLYQAMTGEMPSHNGLAAKFGFGPETSPEGFPSDVYRATRATGWIGERDKINPEIVGYADQVINNWYNGDPVDKNIPQRYLEQAISLANLGVKQAAEDRAMYRGSAYMTGVSVAPWTDEEQAQTKALAALGASGYSPDNPVGSKGLRDAQIDQSPTLQRAFLKGSDTPAVDVHISNLYDQINVMQKQKADAQAAAIAKMDVRYATDKEMRAVREQAGAPYDARIKAAYASINQLKGQQTAPDSTKPKVDQRSPQEQEQDRLDGIFKNAYDFPGKPTLPANASDEQKKTYYAAVSKWYKDQNNYVIGQIMGSNNSSTADVLRNTPSYTPATAAYLWRQYQDRNKTDKEIIQNGTNAGNQKLLDDNQAFFDIDSKDYKGKVDYLNQHKDFAQYEAEFLARKYGKAPWWVGDGHVDGLNMERINDAADSHKGAAGLVKEQGDGSSDATGSSSGNSDGEQAAKGGNGHLPNGDKITRADLGKDYDYYYDHFLSHHGEDGYDTSHWQQEEQWLRDHPEVAEYEWRRYQKKHGKLPTWYDYVYDDNGDVSTSGGGDTGRWGKLGATRSSHSSGGGGSRYGSTRRGSGGGASWKPNWDEYHSLDNKQEKGDYLRSHPDFAKEYLRYSRTQDKNASAWWDSNGDGQQVDHTYDKAWDEYSGLGNDWDAKKQYMLDHPEFAKYWVSQFGEDAAWWLSERGGSGYGGGGGGGGYAGHGHGNGINVVRPHNLSVQMQQLDKNLWAAPLQGKPWIPYSDVTPEWLKAGQQLAPDQQRPWQPPRFG
jgi:hypothetical protein